MSSSILDAIMTDIKNAMKSKDSGTLLTLRTLHADIKNVGINQKKEITDEDVASLIAKGIKQRLDSIEQFKKANRQDLVEKEQRQIDIYKKYQPAQLERAEIEELSDRVIAETGAESKKDMGKVMKSIMPAIKGRADGKLVNEIVNSKLA